MITNTELEKKGNIFPSKITAFDKDVNSFTFTTENGVVLQVTILRGELFRFRYSTNDRFANDFSYAINNHYHTSHNQLEMKDDSEYYTITTSKLICKVAKKNLKVKMYDSIDGTLVNQDELGFHWEESYEHGGDIVKMSKVSHDGESYFGLGDKSNNLNLKGKRFENWVTDSYAYGKETDPIYKAIPFYTGLYNKKAYGIFFDNTFRSFFDFSQERRYVTSFWAQGGEMNYYFIYGPNMVDVVKNYTELTGKPKLPPLWALGFHQCKWSYFPESKVKEITSTFRQLQIPCDAIYLDIDYMDGFRCFTWNKDYFPDPKRMVKELADDGFKTVAIIDPGIKIDPDYEIFQEGLAKDYFCKRADGPYAKGKVWPGECYFPDFTKPEVRKWWAGLFKELIGEIGVRGVWNDMNEPAIMEVPNKTFPHDVRHDYDDNPCSHRKAHNIYGMQMARATYHGVKKFAHPKRPFVITRAAYSGTQRYTSTWTGDNIANWEHLWIANVQVQRLATSGFSFAGSDIGGFAEQPQGELFTRWIQLGAFHPFFRVHSSGDHGEQEPWTFGEDITDIVRKFIELRYQLLPYLYTAFWEYTERGIPLIKSLVMYDQEDANTHYRIDEFIFGNSILVCPVLEPNAKGRRMYIPRGNWYNYWTDKIEIGGKEIWVEADIDTMPLFIKEGAIIPKYPVQQYVGEKKIEETVLDVYYKEGVEDSQFFEDLQDGYDYTTGNYCLRTFKLTGRKNQLVIQQHIEGSFKSDSKTFKIQIHGLPFKIDTIQLDNQLEAIEAVEEHGYLSITVNEDFTELDFNSATLTP
ncbi:MULTISPECIES: glycoside hydrolase family 31 protein [Mesonia]|uniref:Oligosaccharide 4-alpha-D-glucosyltransferase n=1 Tax=Mesonia oceanica TaxID=2687242 RepID=A0AC61Y573_9FLAO|nr:MULTISPECIES: glycoside hydrolase family 31 protein [Mesonia]MAN28719.1 glycosyl hydrolase [Mesonia sp.]MBJ99356.1 glycosyl hydrolase [Flavobacteriaceae bacterium]VVU99643.1 Oligosaccharide 4-alpha-D-glucosyltransferase [Mesonia oceanica]|tara:strand:+ start:7330 stop:9744 length:2415 start_codon:yes stop_codon:yes gene_type:complete